MEAEYTDRDWAGLPICSYVSLDTANAREAELLAEIAELKKDRERLEWLIKEQLYVLESSKTFCVMDTGCGCCSDAVSDDCDTPREAIDSAMKNNT